MLDRWIPRSTLGAAATAIGMTIAIGSMFTVLGTEVLRSYGWGSFVALPFCLGLFSVLVYSCHEPRSFGSCISVALGPLALLGAVLILVMIEGLICILMAWRRRLRWGWQRWAGCWGTRFKQGIG